jgi:membrane-associated protease RseP (regulator of RpoE activity)
MLGPFESGDGSNLPVLQREVLRPTSDRGRLAALATICSLAGVALGFALAGTMFASIPMAARVSYPAHVRCAADTPAWIGVGIRDDGGPAPGAWVRTVRPGSPAAANKLAVGDVITAIDHQPVRDNDSLVRAVRSRRPGTAVTLTVKRGAGQFERPIILQQMPQAVWVAEQAAERRAR